MVGSGTGAGHGRQGGGAIGAYLGVGDAALLLQIGYKRYARSVLALVGRSRPNGKMRHAGMHAALDAASTGVDEGAGLVAQAVVEALVQRGQGIGRGVVWEVREGGRGISGGRGRVWDTGARGRVVGRVEEGLDLQAHGLRDGGGIWGTCQKPARHVWPVRGRLLAGALTFALGNGPVARVADVVGVGVVSETSWALLGGRQAAGQRGDGGQRLALRHGGRRATG